MQKRLSHGQLSRYWFSLAALFGSGVPLLQAFQVAAEQSESVALQEGNRRIAQELVRGRGLAESLERTGLFSKYSTQVLKVGERTGCLHQVLLSLGRHEEWLERQNLALRKATVYPAFTLLLTASMLLAAPALFLRGQLDLLRTSGLELPILTRMLILLSDLQRMPTAWILGSLALLVGGGVLLSWSKTEQARRTTWLAFSKVPLLGSLLHKILAARFARALARMLEAGSPLLAAVRLAAGTTELPSFQESVQIALADLEQGESLAESFARTGLFDPLFLGCLQAGEESGKTSACLSWLAELYDLEVEADIASMTTLLEPMLMLFTGVMVGLMLVATLGPTVQLLQVL